MDRLNIQAHKNAMNSSDEYVMDSFVTFDKVSELQVVVSNQVVVDTDGRIRLADDRGMERESFPTPKE